MGGWEGGGEGVSRWEIKCPVGLSMRLPFLKRSGVAETDSGGVCRGGGGETDPGGVCRGGSGEIDPGGVCRGGSGEIDPGVVAVRPTQEACVEVAAER